MNDEWLIVILNLHVYTVHRWIRHAWYGVGI